MSPRSHYGSVARGIPSLVPQPVDGLGQQEHEVVSDRRDHPLPKRWRKPSPWILLCLVPFVAIIPSGTIAPRIEVYTLLACRVHKPDMYPQTSLTLGTSINVSETLSTAFPPVLRNEYAPSQWELSLSSSAIFLPQNGTRVTEKPGSCASDPVVQAAVAKLTTAISTTAGVLGCLTTAWWGSFSDRHGRIRLLSVAVVGRLVTDLNFILVSRYFQHLPGGYWFMIFGPVVDSLLGDLAAFAAIFAYVADTTTEEARSRMFSIGFGLQFIGFAMGPILGSLLTHHTGKPLSVFYAATVVDFVIALFVWFVIPESLSESKRRESRAKYEEELREITRHSGSSPADRLVVRLKQLLLFLSPLAVFLPELTTRKLGDGPLESKRRDWSLTILAAVYGLCVSTVGGWVYKFQFAAANFSWSSETIGYWITLIAAVNAMALTLIVPFIIKVFKPKPVTVKTSATPSAVEQQPLIPPENLVSQAGSEGSEMVAKESHCSSFEYGLARASLFLQLIAYSCVAMVPSALFFTVFGMFGALGAGLEPNLQSVALAIYTRRGGTESGRLFGALSVIRALSTQILSPAVYGVVYMKTVATFPRAIFILTTMMLLVAFLLLGLVRLPNDTSRGVSGLESSCDNEDEEVRIGSGQETHSTQR